MYTDGPDTALRMLAAPAALFACPIEPMSSTPPPRPQFTLCYAHLQHWQFIHCLAGRLAFELAGLMVPGCTLQVEPRHVAAHTAPQQHPNVCASAPVDCKQHAVCAACKFHQPQRITIAASARWCSNRADLAQRKQPSQQHAGSVTHLGLSRTWPASV